jgi:hypothetical protein
VGDLACGTLVVTHGEGTEIIRFYGTVAGIRERHCIRVLFDHFEHLDVGDEEDEIDVASYLGVEIAIHAAVMNWNDDHSEWHFDLPENSGLIK